MFGLSNSDCAVSLYFRELSQMLHAFLKIYCARFCCRSTSGAFTGITEIGAFPSLKPIHVSSGNSDKYFI